MGGVEEIMGNVAKIENKQRVSLVEKFASTYHLDADKLLPILKATAFKVKNGEVSNEQMAALLVVADQYGLNPFTKEIYAFPDKQNGIVPVVGVDGWARVINSHESLDGMEFEPSSEIVKHDKGEHKPCPEYITCRIYRKDQRQPISVTEYFDECYRPPFKGKDGYVTNGPWQTHTKRMLRHKAMIQCARVAFGFVGIYDPDEAERIRETTVIDVTPTSRTAEDLNSELGITDPEAE